MSETKFEDLTYISSLPSEDGIFYSLTNRKQNKVGTVNPTKEMKDFVLGSPKNTIISIHNHPNSSVPSLSDLLSAKNYKYGIYNNKGDVILDNDFDFIYMPNPKTLRIQYKGNWYEIESISKNESIKLPDDSVQFNMDNQDFKMTQVFINTGIGTGYTVVTATDYLLKIFASISPAYEQTIDDLMLSQGAETVSIFVKLGWIPKFPFVYAKKYWSNLVQPNKSPLAEVRNELKGQIK